MKTFGRRTISIILSVMMVLSCVAGLTFSVGAETDGGFEYTILEDGTAELTGYNGINIGPFIIPSEIGGRKVTSIGENAFFFDDDDYIYNVFFINELIIPNSVTTIKDGAFAFLYGVKKITLPENLVSIGDGAFYYNFGLEEIVLPNALVKIGKLAFSGTNLKTVNIPAGVTSIGASAFSMPEGDKETINAGIKEDLNSYPYSILGDINISTLKNDVTEINVDEKNTVYSSENGILFNKDKTSIVAYPPGLTGEYTIPETVNKIEEDAFVGSKLSKVTVPASMKKIDKGAFRDSDIMNFVLSDEVESIESEAFARCRKLASFAFPLSVTKIGYKAFMGCAITNIIIPASVTYMGDYSFGFYELYNERYKVNNFTINGYSGSEAEKYANLNQFKFVAYPVCSHSYIETLNEIKATCTKGGFSGDKRCAVCGLMTEKGSEVKPLGHKEEKIPAKSATCAQKGLTEGIKCSVCGEIIKAQEEVPTTAHKEEKIAGKTATCTEKGLTDGVVCSVCGKVLTEQKEIPALGHKEAKIAGKSATCTEKGLTDGAKCSVCGKVLTEQKEIPSLGHKEVKIEGKSATCTEKGLTDGAKCSVCCKVTKEQKEIPALGHSFKDGVCTVCGAIDPDYKLMLNSDSKLILSEEKAMIFGIPESTGGMTAGDFKSQISNKINIGIDDSAIITNGLKFSFGNTEYSIILKGDVNADGKITAKDARTILRIAARLEQPDDVTKEAADIDSDGKVTSKEARSVLRFTAKLQKKIYE